MMSSASVLVNVCRVVLVLSTSVTVWAPLLKIGVIGPKPPITSSTFFQNFDQAFRRLWSVVPVASRG